MSEKARISLRIHTSDECPQIQGGQKHTDPDSGCTVYRQYSVADLDPGSVAFLTLGSRIRDPGWVKSLVPDPG